MTGLYSQFQPVYAARGISTVPCSTDKIPLVKHYGKMGIPATTALAKRFTDANAFGFLAGKHNRITVLDVDTTDERVLADAITRHGEPRIVVRTASAKYHAYYRHNGEPRAIRPRAWKPLPIDLLGGGVIIAAPSLFGRRQYELIHGTLDDLNSLTTIRNVDDIVRPRQEPRPKTAPTMSPVAQGKRNISLFNHLMRYAASIRPNCTRVALEAEARDANARYCIPMLEETETMTIGANVWGYESSGTNRFGQHGAWIPVQDAAAMMMCPDVLALLVYLKANEGPCATFMIPNTLAERFDWTLRRVQNARRLLIDMGRIRRVKPAYTRSPALFRWRD